MIEIIGIKTASNLQKLSSKTKLQVLGLICLCLFALPGKIFSQNFPSESRPNAALTENFFSKENFISPTISAGTLLEFRQIYALNISFCGSYLRSEEKTFPLIGFNYDLYYKLFRKDPPAIITPVFGMKISKQWRVRGGETALQRSILNDLANWRNQYVAGIDFVPFGDTHVKILGGVSLMIGPREYLSSAFSPCVIIMGEL